MSQHSTLDLGRWSKFGVDQQILMIGNEMNRSLRFLDEESVESLRRGYERILRLTDLTASCLARPALRRELLRWRDLVAELYLCERPDESRHRAAFRALLHLNPRAARQIPLLLGDP